MAIEIKTFKARTSILPIKLNCKKDICSDKKYKKAIRTNEGTKILKLNLLKGL
jgi:hypothetical protein